MAVARRQARAADRSTRPARWRSARPCGRRAALLAPGSSGGSPRRRPRGPASRRRSASRPPRARFQPLRRSETATASGLEAAARCRIRGCCATTGGPRASRASSSSGTIVIASTAPAASVIVIGCDPIATSPLCPAKRQASLEPGGGLCGSGEPRHGLEALAEPHGGARRARDNEPRLLQPGEPPGEGARAVEDVHEAVRLPLHVVEFGDHIAGDRLFPAQGFDLVFEGAVLQVLRRFDEAVEVAEHRRKSGVAEARFDPVRISGAAVPLVAALEPPGLAAVPGEDIARMGQSPDAELRAHQRFVAPLLRIAVRRPRKGRARCEGLRRRGEGFVLVREAVVPVKVLDVGLEVIVAREARRSCRPAGCRGSAPSPRRNVSISQRRSSGLSSRSIPHPSLNKRPDADGRMMPVVDDGAAKRLAARPRASRARGTARRACRARRRGRAGRRDRNRAGRES